VREEIGQRIIRKTRKEKSYGGTKEIGRNRYRDILNFIEKKLFN